MRFVLALSLLCVASGCVHRAPTLRMDEAKVTADLDLLKLNDEELFARGTSAFAASEFDRAARCFGRIADFFPKSPHRREALYNAGLSHERLKEWEQADARFVVLADPAHGTGDALDATFRLAETEYQLGRFEHAMEMLNTVATRSDLTLNQRLEALVQVGICQVEAGQLDAAESTLRKAIDWYQSADGKDQIDDYFPAQGQFFLGEVYRLRYESVPLKPELGADKLSEDLEVKAELLLSAQGHYMRSIKMGNGYWATASGTEIGGLYENLYHQMVDAPAPKELNEEEATIYRQELRKKIRVLLSKAISIYESTLDAAFRMRTNGAFVEKARESLKRMKDLLLASVAEDGGDSTADDDDDGGKQAPAPAKPKPHS